MTTSREAFAQLYTAAGRWTGLRTLTGLPSIRPAGTSASPPGRSGSPTGQAVAAGATRWHEGQFEGGHVRPPVFPSRRPDETPDSELDDWYRRLLATIAEHNVRSGDWRLLKATGWPDNQSYRHLLAWSWSGPDNRLVIVVNLSDQPAQGRVRLDCLDLETRSCQLTDLLSDPTFDRDGAELADAGLYVALEAHQFHLLAVQ